MQENRVPWTDNWWIEEDKAWFCGGGLGALFYVDMNNLQCRIVQQIPECEFINFRLFSYCLKYKRNLFCMPTYGKCIWCYSIDQNNWKKIEIDSEYQILICMVSYQKDIPRIFFRDDEGNFFEIDLDKKDVSNVYCLPLDDEVIVGGYVLVESTIYCVSANKIHCIDLCSTKINTYEVPAVKAELYTIAYDGKNFWLSGFYKEIYVWNPRQGVVKIITDFPKQFGIYSYDKDGMFFTDYNSVLSIKSDIYDDIMAFGRLSEDAYAFFSDSIALGRYVWFTPHRSNGIIYIDRETYQVYFMEIEWEKETGESIETNFIYSKYLIEYVREDRYIGIYSVKNQWIFEIDTVKLCVRKRNYELDNQSILYMAKTSGYYDDRNMFREGRQWDSNIFSAMIKSAGKNEEKSFQNVGKRIYRILSEGKSIR